MRRGRRALRLYPVLRDPLLCGRLAMLCAVTPFSGAEFRLARVRLSEGTDPVERARRMLARHAMQVSSDVRGETQGTGYRRYTGPGHCAAHDWSNFPDALAVITAGLGGGVVEGGGAIACMLKHDRPDALHFCDPPYVHETRREKRKGYAHELDDAQHRELLDCLLWLKGMVVVSGYATPLYDEALVGWRRVTREVSDHARQRRAEVLWISPSAVAATAWAARQMAFAI